MAPEQQISVFETVMRGTSSAQQSGNAPEAGQAEDIKITYQRKTSAEASTEEASSVTPAVTPEEVVPETAPEMPPETLPETLPETAPETAPEALAGSLSETAAESTDPMPLFARYQVESYLAGMFNPTVQLKSGGYIVIDCCNVC